MRVRLLGSLELSDGEHSVPVGGTKRRALLAYLVAADGEVRDIDRIVDALWGQPSDRARNTVKTYVSQFRRLLERDPQLGIETVGSGYRFVSTTAEGVDATAFRLHLTLATAARDQATRLRHLDHALACWSGAALADFAGEPWADDVARALEQERLVAAELRCDALLALGRVPEAVVALEPLVRANPVHEALWCRYATALHRAGRQTEALRALADLRTWLDEEIGVQPGPAVVALERSILTQEGEGTANAIDGQATVNIFLGVDGRRRLPMVGRGPEQELLLEAWTRARSGAAHLVVIHGEPGIGKTTLAAWLAREARGDGATIALGTVAPGPDAPYNPWIEVLEGIAASAPDDVLADHLVEHGAALAPLVPNLRFQDRVPPGSERDPMIAQQLAWAAATHLINRSARHEPLLIVLEDLHWANHGTLELLMHIVDRLGSASVLVVATFRDGEGDVDALTALCSTAAVDLAINGLTLTEVASLVQRTGDEQLELDGLAVAAVVHRCTDGNPLFVEQLVSHLVEHRADTGGWNLDQLGPDQVPPTVREVLRRRLQRLDAPTLELLEAGATLGIEFEASTIATMVGAPAGAVDVDLRAAAETSLIHALGAGRFSFAHALGAATVRAGLGPSRAARLHERAALAIEATPDADARVAEVAGHWLASGPDAGDRAVDATTRAGDQALRSSAPAEAARWYRRALDALAPSVNRGRPPGANDPQIQRIELLIRLGEAERAAGSASYRDTLLDATREAQSIGDTGRLVRAAVANTRGLGSSLLEADLERLEGLDAALAVATRPADRARLASAAALERHFHDVDAAAVLMEEAISAARASGDRRALVEALMSGPPCAPASTARDVLCRIEEAVEHLDGLDDPWLEVLVCVRHTYARLRAGLDISDAQAARDAAIDRWELPMLRWRCTMQAAAEAALIGHHGEAVLLAEQALAQGTASGQPDALAIYGGMRIAWAALGQDFQTLEAFAQLGAAAFPDIDTFPSALAAGAWGIGDPDRALALFRADAAHGFTYANGATWSAGVVASSVMAAIFEDQSAAARLESQARPFAGEIATISAMHYGAWDHYLGELALVRGDLNTALADLERAERIHRRLGYPIALCATRLVQAKAFTTAGSTDAARRAASESLGLAKSAGLPLAELQALSLLSA